ncbi:hypothetical protein SSX86_021103 [Deinandra increscens subsp. villosa]|uniref:SBP-type domain-containing protein n=1 Tax=Deinandra increscens subsp. villosa TaxID=3103831 RepID=A0AAP0CW73_9ASTR
MDWVFTPSASSWEFTELDADVFHLLEKNQTMEDFCNYGTSEEGGILNKLSEENHSVISSKEPRADSSEQQVSCLVDGCKADLHGCRDYHRRHRVCETHSKTPVVIIGGRDKRFCQQCSRFHPLREFDEVKRSCRKRLDGHNKRRRKTRPESIYFDYESFFTNQQGTKLLHFGGSPAYTTTFGGHRDEEKLNQKLEVTVEHRTTPSNSYARFCGVTERRFKFPFLLDVDSHQVNQPQPEAPFPQFVNTNATSAHLLVEPQGVLYLLSNSKHIMHHASVCDPTNNLQVQFNGSSSQHSGSHISLQNVTGPSYSYTNDQLIGMIQFRPDGLLENEAAQVLSFSWDNHHLKP